MPLLYLDFSSAFSALQAKIDRRKGDQYLSKFFSKPSEALGELPLALVYDFSISGDEYVPMFPCKA